MPVADPTASRRRSAGGLRGRIAFWLGIWILTLLLGIVLGLIAEGVLGIHYRWGLGLGIAIGVAVGDSLRDGRASKASAG